MRQKNSRQALIRKVRRILKSGGVITVYGWKDSNHNQVTRAYANTGRIKFVQKNLKLVGVSADFVICTTFIKHADTDRLCKCYDVYYPCLNLGEIREVLHEAEEHIFQPKPVSKPEGEDVFQADSSKTVGEQPLIDHLEMQLYNEEVVMDKYDELANAFKECAVNHSQEQPYGMVSSQMMRKILAKIGLHELSKTLCMQGWLIAHRQKDKQRIGWYLPGDKLIDRIALDPAQEPKDPIDKARFLIDRRPFLEEQVAEARKTLEEREAQLRRVDVAESLIKQLEEV